MKISEILKENRVNVSFEVFPPKQWDKIETTKNVVREMSKEVEILKISDVRGPDLQPKSQPR